MIDDACNFQGDIRQHKVGEMKAVRVSEKSRLTRHLQFLLLLYQNETSSQTLSSPSFLTNDPSAHPSAFTNSAHFSPII